MTKCVLSNIIFSPGSERDYKLPLLPAVELGVVPQMAKLTGAGAGFLVKTCLYPANYINYKHLKLFSIFSLVRDAHVILTLTDVRKIFCLSIYFFLHSVTLKQISQKT